MLCSGRQRVWVKAVPGDAQSDSLRERRTVRCALRTKHSPPFRCAKGVPAGQNRRQLWAVGPAFSESQFSCRNGVKCIGSSAIDGSIRGHSVSGCREEFSVSLPCSADSDSASPFRQQPASLAASCPRGLFATSRFHPIPQNAIFHQMGQDRVVTNLTLALPGTVVHGVS